MLSVEDAVINDMSRFQRVGRVSAIDIAVSVLGDNLKTHRDGHFVLWRVGNWCHASLDDVMRATNTKLQADCKHQVKSNPAWVVA